MDATHPPSPSVTPEAAPYWAAAADSRLLIKACRACGELHHYPRPHCPFCLSSDTEWREASGGGVLYAATVIRKGPGAGLAPAFVTLDEGLTIQAGLVDCEPEAVQIGARLRVVFKPSENGTLVPMFRPDLDAEPRHET